MEQSRGRSPSQGDRSRGTSPHPYSQVSGVDPSVQEALTSGKFNTATQFSDPFQHNVYQYNQQQYQDNRQQFQESQQQFQENQFSGNLDQSFQNYMYQQPAMPEQWQQNYSMDPNYTMNQQSNINPADLSKVSTPQDQSSPNLLSPEHSSPGPQPPSPASTNGQYYTPQHSRHTSLDPASAYGEVFAGTNFQQHRRAPSDHSDVSSAQHSPYLAQAELASDAGHSPYLAAQQDTSDTFGMDSFSIGDQSYRSPRLMPQMETQQGLGVSSDAMGMPVPEVYTTQAEYRPAHLRNQSLGEMGRADQFAPPTINIEPAPVSRQASFGPDGGPLQGALSPPNSARGRNRSKSDLTGLTRPMSRSVSPGPKQSPQLGLNDNLSVRSYSPGPSVSRESSPGPTSSGRIDKNRRASTSSVNNRDYILDLADPGRPGAAPNTGNSSRVQKHPATFQCHLCPKKFTRAYNLRSHLRTHTDERPFVCTVCGKAFARQHDRKRHEGLHSGEKKFVCRGELRSQPGQHWGCNRRFARADALGRHFRSEAGRVCIKPLLDEEAAERRNKQMMEQQQQMQYNLQPAPQPLMIGMDPATGAGGFSLPAALLAQYPALQNIDWSQVPSTQDDGELSDVGMNRPSYDGSSGGEYYEDDMSEGYVSGSGMTYPPQGQQQSYM